MLYSNRVSEMLKRKITSEIEDWHQNGTTGLLIDGARQIGKTTVIEEYLTSHQLNYIEFNLLSNKLALEAFNTASDEKNCCSVYPLFQEKRLSKVKRFSSSMKSRKRMMPSRPSSSSSRIRNTSIFFLVPCLESRCRISYPFRLVSSPSFKCIRWISRNSAKAIGVSDKTFEYLRDCFTNHLKVDDIIHKKMMNLFNTYLVVGGMPRAVQIFVETKDIYRVNKVLSDIDYGYREDIDKYQKDSKLLIQEIYDLIPSELNAQTKRFILKNLNEKARFYQYEASFAWLKNSGVGLFVHNVDNPIYPLLASKERTLFKLFLSDVGLLTYKFFNGNQAEILNGNTTLNYCAIHEAATA